MIRSWLVLALGCAMSACAAEMDEEWRETDAAYDDETEGEAAYDEELGAASEELITPTRLPCSFTVSDDITMTVARRFYARTFEATRALFFSRSAAVSAQCPTRVVVTNGEGWSDRSITLGVSVPYASARTDLTYAIRGVRWDGTSVVLARGVALYDASSFEPLKARISVRVWDYRSFEIEGTAITSPGAPFQPFRREAVAVDVAM